MQKLFQIGEVAKLFHLSPSSIRHYENIGLLKPEYIDPDTGYRYYSPRQFEVFNSIRYLRALDMPLPEIADFLRNRDVDIIEEKLRRQKDLVLEKKRELERIERRIDARLEQFEQAQHAPLGVIERRTLPACRLFLMSGTLKVEDYCDLELPTSRLAERQEEAAVFLGKVGVSISRENLAAGNFGQYDGIFLVVDDDDHFSGETLALPETDCVTVRFRGSHPEAPEQYRALTAYIKEKHLEITGFSREITIIDYVITNDPEKFVTEISIPVGISHQIEPL